MTRPNSRSKYLYWRRLIDGAKAVAMLHTIVLQGICPIFDTLIDEISEAQNCSRGDAVTALIAIGLYPPDAEDTSCLSIDIAR